MSTRDVFLLIFLSAVWGASFFFVRIAVPEFGPFALILLRVGGAALMFLPIFLKATNRKFLRTRARSLLVLGFFNAALPFTLFAWAGLFLPAGFTSLLNASTPIFTAIIGFLWLSLPLGRWQILGLLIAFSGITILTGDSFSFEQGGLGWPILAVFGATCSYGLSAHLAKLKFSDVPPLLVSAGNLFYASLFLIPLAFLYPPESLPSASAFAAGLALAVLCTAIAFVLFFGLLRRTGATAAATVTFIIPIFGILWGALFLSEEVSGRMILGMAVALFGTALVTKVLPRTTSQPRAV